MQTWFELAGKRVKPVAVHIVVITGIKGRARIGRVTALAGVGFKVERVQIDQPQMGAGITGSFDLAGPIRRTASQRDCPCCAAGKVGDTGDGEPSLRPN